MLLTKMFLNESGDVLIILFTDWVIVIWYIHVLDIPLHEGHGVSESASVILLVPVEASYFAFSLVLKKVLMELIHNISCHLYFLLNDM